MQWSFSPYFYDLLRFMIPLITFLVVLILGFILRRILFTRLLHWASKTESHLDDIIISSTKGPFVIWCIMLGIYFALKQSQFPPEMIQITGKILLVLGIVSVSIVLSHISTGLIKVYSGKIDSSLPVTSLTQNIARILIFIVGTLVILNSLGISIAPILATLGVGGLAAALALQDTFSNFFSGFHIIATKQVKVGDYIKLESGEEGYVADINWRTTKIRMLPNNLVLVPNIKLIQSVITNYYLPNKEIIISVNLGVHYNSDLEKVEEVTYAVAKGIMNESPGGVPLFEPAVRFNGFSDFSINLSVSLKAKEYVDQYLIKHEFIKRLQARYLKEGIVIPYPVRAINNKQEKES